MGLFGPPNIEKLKAKKDVPGLIKALGYQKDKAVRKAAAQALGAIGDIGAVEPLISTLADNDKNVREIASTALSQINTPAVEPLISALRYGIGYQCLYAAIVLGTIGDSRAVDALVTACSSDHKIMRLVAIGALTQIRPPAVKALVAALGNQHNDVCEVANEALVKIGRPAVKPLVGALKTSEVSSAAMEVLIKIGKPAAKPLITALLDNDGDQREVACEALDKIGWQPDKGSDGAAYWIAKGDFDRCVKIGLPAVKPLISTFMDGGWRSTPAVKALGKIGIPAVNPLIAALKHKNSNVRDKAAESLGEIGDPLAVEPLIISLKDKDWFVRDKAAVALGKLGDSRAVDPLIAALKAPKKDWGRGAFAEALGAIGDSRSIEPLITALEDESPSVQEKSAIALGKIGDSRAVAPLIAALKDNNSGMRATAANVLGQIGDTQAEEPLIAALVDQNWHVRSIALNSLEKLGWKPDRGAKGAAYWIVKGDLNKCAQIGASAVGPLNTALGFSFFDPPTRGFSLEEAHKAAMMEIDMEVALIKAVDKLGDPRSVEPLIEKLYRDTITHITWRIRSSAARALIKIYHSGKLTEEQKALILKHRPAIVKSHHDGWAPSDCIHDDTGIGVKFPV